VSKHHYAIVAGEFGNHVWFLLPGIQPSTFDEPLPHHITLVPDRYQFTGLRWLPSFLRKKVVKKKIDKLQFDLNTTFDVVWNFDNSRFYDLDCFDVPLTIHHCMDYHYNFQLAKASRTADICFGVTDGIVSNLKKYNPHSYFIHHGYRAVEKSSFVLPTSNSSLRAVFVGNFMRKDIAWSWLLDAVKTLSHIHFYFIGNCGLSNLSQHIDPEIEHQIQTLSLFKNVTFTGELNEKDSWTAMCEADILFAAFRADLHPEIFANLHKIMPYLATGKPIVINRILQYESNPDLLLMAHDSSEFVSKFKLLSNKPDEYFGEKISEKRIAFAKANTYEKQFERIDQLICQHIQ